MPNSRESQDAKRSPIKERPLNAPGESLQRWRESAIWDKAMVWIVVSAFMVVFAAFEWVRWLLGWPYQPTAVTVGAAGAVLLSVVMVRRQIPFFRQLKQGIAGEKSVGQYLEDLRTDGFRVLHDIEGDGFNVDHVLVGPPGVFAIETKTISKPAKGSPNIRCDGRQVFIGNQPMERNPIQQATACADFIRQLIERATARKVPVRPVVLFPGWFVEPLPKGTKVWVLNPKALPSFLKQEDSALSDDDVRLIASALETHVRSQPQGQGP